MGKMFGLQDTIATGHVETVVCLDKKNAKLKDYVEIGVDAEDYYRIKDSEESERNEKQ
jgi:23S rRNA (uracil1939-C5)-methyltransferase